MYSTKDLYEEGHSLASSYIHSFTYPWEALSGIKNLILEIGKTLSPDEYDNPKEGVWIHKEASVMPSAYIGSPCIIERVQKSDTAHSLGEAPLWEKTV